jgi:hypothetical protein
MNKGLKAYSDDLVIDTDLELVDVFPGGKNAIYELAGSPPVFSFSEFEALVSPALSEQGGARELLNVFLWQGAIGAVDESGKQHFIYDVGYNIARLNVIIRRSEEAKVPSLAVHIAFHRGLDTDPRSI